MKTNSILFILVILIVLASAFGGQRSRKTGDWEHYGENDMRLSEIDVMLDSAVTIYSPVIDFIDWVYPMYAGNFKITFSAVIMDSGAIDSDSLVIDLYGRLTEDDTSKIHLEDTILPHITDSTQVDTVITISDPYPFYHLAFVTADTASECSTWVRVRIVTPMKEK